jgi:hypothetical protein
MEGYFIKNVAKKQLYKCISEVVKVRKSCQMHQFQADVLYSGNHVMTWQSAY